MKTVKLESQQLRKLIQEERAQFEKNQRFERLILREINRLESESLQGSEINEAVFDFIEKLGSGFLQSMKFKLAQSLLSYLKIDKGSILSNVISNLFENISLARMKEYFEEDGPEKISEDLVQTIAEAGIIEPIADKAAESLGVDSDSPIYMTVRESIVDGLVKEIKTGDFKNMIVGFLDDFDFKSILAKATGTADGAKGFLKNMAKSFL